ncbi:MAG: hypothetical protein BWK80_61845 [Desulfobacteraceae bacterium IS3]|nr:MAG: hypothetical protein BWK80_61845 [Desulfobacteraceae bacterium IS3]
MKTLNLSEKTVLSVLLALFLFPISCFAEDGICASVKIEIRQEMSFERQAFDAHMRVNNGLDGITLENVKTEISFTDENGNSVLASSDPNNTTAKFFVGKPSMTNIDDVDGIGKIDPSTTADIHWLIVPALGASNGLQSGTLYYVGATLTYTINGEENITEVSPDYIFVKPMPELTLDYFLPEDVYGDDTFTDEIEPIVPFTLGVRVSNNGTGTAKNLKIESAQPKIIENDQELLIGFNIEGCEVNGEPATPSLLADFGDIQPKTSGTARWIMTCSLSGKFTNFTADFSHSDELGGELTSLLKAADTHTLIHDVLADAAGRDNITDFLAKYGDGYRVYESENIDNDVSDLSASSSLSGSGDNYKLSTSSGIGFIYVKLTDPKAGAKILKEVVRSDGKVIKPENAWLSKSRLDKSKTWQYFFNLFDTDSTGSYTVIFEDKSAESQPPNLQFIPERTGNEGQQIGFIVEASDPNGTIPLLSASPLPVGAKFADKKNGKGEFSWTPAIGQAGKYVITFIASDGTLSASRNAVITITRADSDKDGMADYWELKYFGNLYRDGNGDFDGDGVSDRDEYLTDGAAPPNVTTAEAKAVTSYSAVCGGNVLSDGGAVVIERGVCWSEATPPTLEDNRLTDVSSGLGQFSVTLRGLNAGAMYYVRAYAKNSKGISYGTVKKFTAIPATPAIPVDIDGSGTTDLRDVILALRIVSGIAPGAAVRKAADINGDLKIGMAEAILALKAVSEYADKN